MSKDLILLIKDLILGRIERQMTDGWLRQHKSEIKYEVNQHVEEKECVPARDSEGDRLAQVRVRRRLGTKYISHLLSFKKYSLLL